MEQKKQRELARLSTTTAKRKDEVRQLVAEGILNDHLETTYSI